MRSVAGGRGNRRARWRRGHGCGRKVIAKSRRDGDDRHRVAARRARCSALCAARRRQRRYRRPAAAESHVPGGVFTLHRPGAAEQRRSSLRRAARAGRARRAITGSPSSAFRSPRARQGLRRARAGRVQRRKRTSRSRSSRRNTPSSASRSSRSRWTCRRDGSRARRNASSP